MQHLIQQTSYFFYILAQTCSECFKINGKSSEERQFTGSDMVVRVTLL